MYIDLIDQFTEIYNKNVIFTHCCIRADTSTTLQRIIDSNLEEYLPKFETVSEAASKEHVFERNLEKMKVSLIFFPFH